MIKKTIIWLRNDLRLSDNAALSYACTNNSNILFLYILDESYVIGAASKWFLYKSLNSFKADIAHKYNAELLIKSGKPKDIIEEIVKNYGITSIVWNRVYEPYAIKRDTDIKEYFRAMNLEVKTFNSSLLFDPSTIKNSSGSYFKVFTPFWKYLLAQLNNIDELYHTPKSLKLIKLQNGKELNLQDLNLLPQNPNWAMGCW